MKKLAVILLLVALPMALFADFYLGPTAMYKGNPQMLTTVPNAGDLAFGAEARLNLSLFEGQAMALYNLNQSINTYLDVGLVLNLAIVSVGVGVGPNFFVNFMPGAPEAASFGFNAKAHVDLNLGGIKISGYYMVILESISVANIQDSLNFGTAGISLLFKL
jgi:hypothetical protein